MSQQLDMDEENTKKELKKLRTARTVRRNHARADVEAITGLHTGNPTFPNEVSATGMLDNLNRHLVRIRELDDKIADLIEDERTLEHDVSV